MPLWLLLLSSSLSTVAKAAEQRPPNVVFILADDLGWADLGCYGSTFYETPNLDRLAAQSVRFTQAYAACPVCSPTRASILTGKYPARLRLTDWLPGRPDMPSQRLRRPAFTKHLALEEVTLAEALRDAGYAAGIVGKWHLGGPAFYPEKQGFDVNVAGCELGHPPSYFSPYKIPNLKDGPEGEYLTDRLTDEAVRFIEHHQDRPFFLYLAHYAVHMPKQAKANLAEQFKAKADALPPPREGPKFRPEGKHEDRRVQDDHVYAAMLKSLDEGVGRVLEKLTELRLNDRTIVIFFSDNGGLSTAEGSPTSNAPLRAGKGWLYEGGIREPLLVRWPGVTRAGRVIDQPVISTDFYPTLLEMTGQPPRPDQHVDGISFTSLLKGDGAAPPPKRDGLFWHYPHYANQGGGPAGAVRQGDWKLIEDYEDFHVELYHLKDDPGELHNRAADLPDKATELRKLLSDWRHDVDAQMPTPNPDFRPPKPKSKPSQ